MQKKKHINVISIEKALFVLFLIANNSFFGIKGISNVFERYCTYEFKILVVVIIVLMWIIMILQTGISRTIILQNTTSEFYTYYCLVIVITLIISRIIYPSDTTTLDYIVSYHHYFVLLLFPVLNWCAGVDEKFLDFLITSTAVVGIILGLISLMTYYIFLQTGFFILNENVIPYFSSSSGVYNSIKGIFSMQTISDSVSLSALFCLHKFLKFESKLKVRLLYFSGYVCCMAALFLVGRTRMLEIVILVSSSLMIIVSSKQLIYKLAVSLSAIVAIYISYEWIAELFTSLSSQSYSTAIRMEAIAYYLNKTFYNLIIGIGLPPFGEYDYLIHGVQGLYYYSDVGYFGIVSIFGIAGMFLIFMFIRMILKACLISLRKPFIVTSNKTLWLGIAVYLILSNFTLSFNDVYRLPYFTILLCILFNFENSEYISEEHDLI